MVVNISKEYVVRAVNEFETNKVGAVVLGMVNQGMIVSDVVKQVVEIFDVDVQTAKKDVVGFIQQAYLVGVLNVSMNVQGNKVLKYSLQGKNVDQIVQRFVEKYEVDEQTARNDVNEFKNQLVEVGLLDC